MRSEKRDLIILLHPYKRVRWEPEKKEKDTFEAWQFRFNFPTLQAKVKFPTPGKTLRVKFPTPRAQRIVKCLGYAQEGCWSFELIGA